MKPKLISFIIAIFCLQFSIQAQNFIDETKQWTVLSTQSMDTSLKFTTSYKFAGDSIINGFSYHKLYMTTDSNQVNWTLSDCPFWFERNDSVFIRGYCCGYLIDTVTLVYDFNIEEGDSFPYYDNQYMIVDSIRYLEWGGSIRKHCFFNQIDWNLYGCITWIEGVGNLENLNFSGSFCIGSVGWELLCFHENGNLVFQNPLYNSCYILTSLEILVNSSMNNISILTSDNGSIIINNPKSEKGVMVFYTIDGRQINELRIESEIIHVDLKESGMILYKFTNLNSKIQTGKFLYDLP